MAAAAAVLAGLAVLVVSALFSRYVPADVLKSLPLFLPVVAVVVLVAGLFFAIYPRYVFLAFLLACMLAPFLLEEINVPLGFMKLYVQDVVFVFNCALLAGLMYAGRVEFRRIQFNRYVVLHLLLGVYGLAVGLVVWHNAFDIVFGDFRRAYFYFLNYFVALYLARDLLDARKLRFVLTAGGVLIMLKGLAQMLTGSYYRRRYGDAAHILSHYELTFLSFLVFYALGMALFGERARRTRWFVLFAAGTLITIIGNYRAAWLGLIGGLGFMFLYLPRRSKRLMVFLGILGTLCMAVAIYALWNVQVVEGRSTIGEEIQAKAHIKETTADANVVWRFQSYAYAMELWRTSPVIGRGLGVYLEFIASTSTGGTMITEGHRVHNSFLWMLLTLGLLGFAVFLFVQYRYVRTLLDYLRHATWNEGRITVLASLAFYVSFMISTSFEIFLESAMPITVLSCVMALSMLMIHYTPAVQPLAHAEGGAANSE